MSWRFPHIKTEVRKSKHFEKNQWKKRFFWPFFFLSRTGFILWCSIDWIHGARSSWHGAFNKNMSGLFLVRTFLEPPAIKKRENTESINETKPVSVVKCGATESANPSSIQHLTRAVVRYREHRCLTQVYVLLQSFRCSVCCTPRCRVAISCTKTISDLHLCRCLLPEEYAFTLKVSITKVSFACAAFFDHKVPWH